VVCNDAAVVLGVGAVVVAGAAAATGVGAPAGALAGGALAIGSFGAWLIGNRYQRLANDPPRDDIETVSVSGASVNADALPAEEPQRSVARLAAQQIVLADALGLLVTSLERFDGAVAAGNGEAASAQAGAVKDNVAVVLTCHSELASLAPTVNAAWTAARPDVTWDSMSLGDVQSEFGTAVHPGGPGMQLVLAAVTGLTDPDTLTDDISQHPVLIATELPPEPDQLVPNALPQQLAGLSDALGPLVTD
jgi:hypothetical protein